MPSKKSLSALMIVAHPDDETLWAGGLMLSRPAWKWHVICLSRASDRKRAERFFQVLRRLGATGAIGDLDDGPDQNPLAEKDVEQAILKLLPDISHDLIITHDPSGEYTRHKRHEEVSKAVISLWQQGNLRTGELWTFAYEDGNKAYYPRAVPKATLYRLLTRRVWLQKYYLITRVYGFGKTSWEARSTPKAEAFWQFSEPEEAWQWMNNKQIEQ